MHFVSELSPSATSAMTLNYGAGSRRSRQHDLFVGNKETRTCEDNGNKATRVVGIYDSRTGLVNVLKGSRTGLVGIRPQLSQARAGSQQTRTRGFVVGSGLCTPCRD